MYLRLILIAILVYLVVKLVRDVAGGSQSSNSSSGGNDRKVSRDVGEYVDYEEVKDDDNR